MRRANIVGTAISVVLLLVGVGATRAPMSVADRLEQLDPQYPMAYFELAEELADRAGDAAELEMARHLFGLAGAIDPEGLGRSACLAQADLARDPAQRRRLLALARLLGADGVPAFGDLSTRERDLITPGTALALSRAFSFYRRGKGKDALEALEVPGARTALDVVLADLPGGSRRFLEDCNLYQRSIPPSISKRTIGTMLRIELGLLAGDERPFSSELELSQGAPLVEVDPERLSELLGVDPRRAWYRGGRWSVVRSGDR